MLLAAGARRAPAPDAMTSTSTDQLPHAMAIVKSAGYLVVKNDIVSTLLARLGRRQVLVDRMIEALDTIERTEEDPKRLARLFQLVQLATRIRRIDENLLVLAGADSTPSRREDALLADILRVAPSEVEPYNRVEFGTVDADVSVAAHAVDDVVHLLAELLDNATRFSPPNTIVVTEARRIGDSVVIQIQDRGLGIAPEQLHDFNQRLAAPSMVDAVLPQAMGLFVVARLAARHGIKVELRSASQSGTVAYVLLPPSILTPMDVSRANLIDQPPRSTVFRGSPSTRADSTR
jgi:signal transduction histidine kinase